LEKDIKQPSEGLEEVEEETVEKFMSHKENLEQQGDMMVEASSETIGSYVSKTDSLYMVTGIGGEKKAFEDIFKVDKDLEVRGDKENVLEEK